MAFGVLALLLLGPLGRFVEQASAWLPYPFPRAGTEGLILYEVLLLKRGGDIYAPITPEQFISAPYPPVYYWLAAVVTPANPPDLSSLTAIEPVFQPGRAISLLAALLAAASIPALVVWDSNVQGPKSKVVPVSRFLFPISRFALLAALLGGIIGGALLLTLPQVMVWSTTYRSDMLMAGFTAAGLACVALGFKVQSSKFKVAVRDQRSAISFYALTRHASRFVLPLGAIFFSLAFFSKQTAIAGPLAAGVYLLLRDWRVGLRWVALMAGMVIVPFALLDLLTGHWFYLKMVDYHSLPLRPNVLVRLITEGFWEDQWPLILVAAGYALYQLGLGVRSWRLGTRERGEANPQALAPNPSLLIPLFVLASFAMLPMGAVAGADHNHLLLPGLAVCAAVGAALAAAFRGLAGGALNVRTAAVAVAVLLPVGVYAAVTSAPSSHYNVNLNMPDQAYQEQLLRIALNIRQNPNRLFLSDQPGLMALAGKETPYDDLFTMNILSEEGRWDESVLREMLREGRFGLLVLACDVIDTPRTCGLTPGVLDALRNGYEVAFWDILFTYTPKQ